MPSEVSDLFQAFLADAQTGAGLSQEALFGVTVVFIGQGNSGGYDAAGGPHVDQLALDSAGNATREQTKAIRVRRSILTADGITLKTLVTALKIDGIAYRLDRLVDRPNDPCLYLACIRL